MSKKKRKGTPSIYACSQQSLYTVAAVVWANYNSNLASFTTFKSKYTAAMATAALAALAAAKLLPNEQARGSVPELVRIALLPLGATCLANQRMLKSYIEDAFPASVSTQLASAGNNSYRAAYNEGWEEMNTMITDGNLFIANNTVALEMTGTNMPAAFVTTYTSGKTAFETIYNNYLLTAQATSGNTNTKMKANNAVYTSLRSMLDDGKLIFEADKTRKALFTFSNVLAKVTGNGTTGMRITAADSVSKVNLTDFTATVQPGDEVGTAIGVVLELKMSEDLYTVVITAPGYHSLTLAVVQLKTGVMHRLDVELVKV